MSSLLLAHCRALIACGSMAIAAAGGCSSTAASSGSTIAGHTLSIYLSEPSGTLSAEQKDVISAEQLALHQFGSRVSTFTVKPVQVGGNELSDNARGAIADPTAIAYLGELVPGTSEQTIGITNSEDILQVSPTDNALEETQSVPEVAGSPGNYYESLSSNGRTFARVVPSDKLEAKVLVSEMQSLAVKSLYVRQQTTYGAVLGGLVSSDASPSITIANSLSSADGVLYAGDSVTAAASLFNQAAAANPSVKLFAPSALAENALVSALSSTAQRDLIVSSPGFLPSDLPAQGRQFVSAFKAAYGHPPATEAIFGYEAMSAVLAALSKAGSSANNHATVVKDFFKLRNRSSVLGVYSMGSDGDISFEGGAPFVLSRVRAGKLVPFKAVPQHG